MKTKKINAKLIGNLAPYIGLIAVCVIFGLLTNGKLYSVTNLQSLTCQIIVTALATIGSIFVFGAGFFYISVTGCICFAAVLGGMATIKTGSLFVGLIVVIIVSLAFGIMKGVFASLVNVPFFIFTIVLGSVLSAAVLVILGSETTLYLRNAVTPVREFSFNEISIINIICLAGFFIVCLILFNYTSLGVKVKNMGGNIVSAKQSGISTKKTTITVFIICAIGFAIAAFLIMIRTRTVGGSTASGVGNDVMVALVLGGMPLSGGPKSKISAGLLGAATITILNSGLSIMGLDTGQIQIFRGVIFIVVVLISSFSYRGKLLPR